MYNNTQTTVYMYMCMYIVHAQYTVYAHVNTVVYTHCTCACTKGEIPCKSRQMHV